MNLIQINNGHEEHLTEPILDNNNNHLTDLLQMIINTESVNINKKSVHNKHCVFAPEFRIFLHFIFPVVEIQEYVI